MIQFFIQKIRSISHCFSRHRINAGSAYAALYLFTSIFPMILFLIGILPYTPVSVNDLMSAVLYVTPEILNNLLYHIFLELYEQPDIRLISLTALATMWSASKGIYGTMEELNIIYPGPDVNRYWKRRIASFLYTFIFLIALAAVLFLLVLGKQLRSLLMDTLPFFRGIPLLVYNLRSVITAVILVLFFAGMYAWIPSQKYPFRNHLPGACFSSGCWIIFSALFSVYFNHFSNYSYLYGSLTAVVLFILWLYICMYLLFVGAEINMWLIEKTPES